MGWVGWVKEYGLMAIYENCFSLSPKQLNVVADVQMYAVKWTCDSDELMAKAFSANDM